MPPGDRRRYKTNTMQEVTPLVLGVDIGGSGIKGAPVNILEGVMISERLRLDTPQPATPEAMARTFAELVRMHNWTGLVGCGFPAIVKRGVAHSAANIDKSWIGINIEDLFSEASGCVVKAMNDADAAGLAAMRFGIGRGRTGVVLVLTIGTGIGSALFLNGQLVPDTEFGHLFFKGGIAEHYVANSVRKREELSWEVWGARFNEYLEHLKRILSPDLIILSGGASKHFDKFRDQLTVDMEIAPSAMLNNAGAIGAAAYAWERYHRSK